ncbi:hypothetical protein [Pseudohoeflea coraliihabitans]|uniref:Uncharacterized protein n=1 Tax=Pseudohoeflea coraliihabitans TaxID=2860393 RepID=A0ABS6WPE6_9HYPH|nr:hypothetical protein [Pseudohoeflea sp. DP4N28-3]MBW3097826.1 hypothetical protein [Pseudohoeflea sp. DP4N28-3]
MKILDAAAFLDMPPGTVFAFGPAFAFSGLKIKEASIRGDTYWGFWACDPCWVDAGDSGEAVDRLRDMQENGASFPMDASGSKYMSYDGDDFECFLVFEPADLDRLRSIMGNGDWG